MSPSLTHRGLMLALVAAFMVMSGSLLAAWPLAALGFVQLSLLLAAYLLFLPRVLVLRRKLLEFAWWVPAGDQSQGVIRTQRSMTIRLLFRNRSALALERVRFSVVGTQEVEISCEGVGLNLPAGREVRFSLEARPRVSGSWFLQGVLIQLVDHLGVFAVHAYFPNRLGLRVVPGQLRGRQQLRVRPRTGTAHERAGPRLLRQRGLGTDLRELREHQPGDPFKRIAWKATARARRLMVREFESEILLTHQILLDISSTMRAGPDLSSSKLEHAVALAATFARGAIELGDRVGLSTFDYRVHRQVSAGEGGAQLQRIMDLLLELHQVVDEDLTDVSDTELFSAVARYLAYQEGVETRRSRRDRSLSSDTGELVYGRAGELIDRIALEQAVSSSLERERQRTSTTRLARYVANPSAHCRASHERLALLRLFCRYRGIELPYRASPAVLGKEQGLAKLIAEAAAPRASRLLVIISDLEGMLQFDPVARALRLCRQRHHTVSVVMPRAAGQRAEGTPGLSVLQQIERARAAHDTREVRRQLRALGVPVIAADSPDALDQLVRSMNTHRAA